MSTNDHTVPRMYLRHFAHQKKKASANWFIRARALTDLDRTFEANITHVAAVTDFYGPRVEALLSDMGAAPPLQGKMGLLRRLAGCGPDR